MSTGTLYPLLRHTAHATRWRPVSVGAVLGLAVVLVPEALTRELTGAQLTDLLRIAATCVALGVAFLLDDPAARSTPTVPISRLARNLVRVAVAMPGLALWWGAATGLARVVGHHPAHPPTGALTLEFAALATAAVALAAITQRHTADGNAGAIAAPGLLVLAAVVWFLPRRVALVLRPTDPQWTAAHQRWTAVLALVVIAFVCASHERVRHPRRPGRSSGTETIQGVTGTF